MFPRRRTLAGMGASVKSAKNAAMSRFQQARDQAKRRKRAEKANAENGAGGGGSNLDECGQGYDENHELNDLGCSTNSAMMTGGARSCFNSSVACPTTNTTMTAANTSVVDTDVTKNSVHFDDISVATNAAATGSPSVVNGNLAPPPRIA